jgi:hypothetical protein
VVKESRLAGVMQLRWHGDFKSLVMNGTAETTTSSSLLGTLSESSSLSDLSRIQSLMALPVLKLILIKFFFVIGRFGSYN